MFEFRLPDLGEGIHEGQVVRVLVKEGDRVEEYQPLFEVETDKAAVEIPSPKAGLIARLYVEPGQIVRVGDVMVVIDETPTGAAASAAARGAARAGAPAAPAVEAAAQPVGERRPQKPAGAAALARVGPTRRDGPVAAAPAVRRLARELGVDLNQVPGSGPGGRVLREDVERFARGEALPAGEQPPVGTPAERAVPGAAVAEPLPDLGRYGQIRREKPTQLRKTVIRQMTRAWRSIPRVTHADNADITELENFRTRYNAALPEGQAKLTITAIVIKALARALHRHPMLNCSYDAEVEELVYKQYVHMGVAVDTPRGLVVPVLRDVDRKPLSQLSGELHDLAERTRTARFDIAELRGATFTITNVGALGGTFVTPMIDFPQVGILALGRASWQPKVIDAQQIVPRLILPLSLSFDHRVVDGADGARFMRDVIAALENPLWLLG